MKLEQRECKNITNDLKAELKNLAEMVKIKQHMMPRTLKGKSVEKLHVS